MYLAVSYTHLDVYKRQIQGLEAAGIRDQVKVIVGGAPISPAFAEKIGADGYSANACLLYTSRCV